MRRSGHFWSILNTAYMMRSVNPASTTTTVVCLPHGQYTIQLQDSNANGWSSSEYLTVTTQATGLPLTNTLTLPSGAVASYTFFLGPMPLQPPSPPMDPPGVSNHEACHLHIRGTRGPYSNLGGTRNMSQRRSMAWDGPPQESGSSPHS